MKWTLPALVVGVVLGFGLSAWSGDFEENLGRVTFRQFNSKKMSESFTPCQAWTPLRTGNGFVCAWTGMRVDVPSSSDYRILEQRVRSLEQKLSAIE